MNLANIAPKRVLPAIGTNLAFTKTTFMIRYFALTLLAASFLASCASHSNALYEPASKPEECQYKLASINVYPDDVRRDIDRYTNTPIAWVGIIRSTDAVEEDFGGKIRADSVFEHHYFDWLDDQHSGGKLVVSPRGEGFFASRWHMKKETIEATAYDAEKFAHPGKLAIVYGVPESVKDDGTIVLKYQYIRILGHHQFTTNDLNYGRLGEQAGNIIGAPHPGTQ